MSLPTITVNNSTGSDTAASGSGGTAISGTGASLNGTTTVDLSADTPDLSGVPTDGSGVLWCDTTSGLQFSKITAVDDGADTVTVATAYSVTESSRNWGIGGKRATYEGIRKLLTADILPGWTVDVDHTGTDYTITSKMETSISGDTTSGKITLKSTSSTRPTINLDTASNQTSHHELNVNHWLVDHLAFDHINTGRILEGVIVIDSGGVNVEFRDCEITELSFGGVLSPQLVEISQNTNDTEPRFKNCWFHDGIKGVFAYYIQKHSALNITGCLFEDLTSYAIHMDDVDGPLIYRNEIVGASYGIYCSGIVRAGNFFHNVIVDSTNDGIFLTGSGIYDSCIQGNIFQGNGGYGLNSDTVPDNLNFADFNAYRSNTSGQANGITQGANEVTLTADPFTNASSGDYTLNDTAGGGAACKAVGGPSEVGLITGTRSNNIDIGAHQSAAGAGGGLLRVGMSGGMNG